MQVQLIKKQSKETYKDKNGNEKHYYNFFVQSENGKRIQIKCCFKEDIARLDMLATYER